MIPGEYFCDGPAIELNAGRRTVTLQVNNTGDRPVQVGSHFHFFEVNRALVFERAAAYGMRLDLPAGTGIRFEPGDVKSVQLVELAGTRRVYGGNSLVMGDLDDPSVKKRRSSDFTPEDSATFLQTRPRRNPRRRPRNPSGRNSSTAPRTHTHASLEVRPRGHP